MLGKVMRWLTGRGDGNVQGQTAKTNRGAGRAVHGLRTNLANPRGKCMRSGPIALVVLFLLALSAFENFAQAGIAIGWSPATCIMSYKANDDQHFRLSFVAQSTGGWTRVSVLNHELWDPAYWHIALDDYDGSVTDFLIDWDTVSGINYPFYVYVTLKPGWMPPGVSDIHTHWYGRCSPVVHATVADPSGGGMGIGSAVCGRCYAAANAVPTVEILRDWTGPWALGEPVTLSAVAHDAEADLWETCYIEYRWDFDGDNVWDTDWSVSNQATHTFAEAGLASVSVQAIDRGYDPSVWWDGTFDGETATYTVTNSVVAANQSPTVDAGGPYQVDEGGSIQLSATGSDPDGDALTYAWDLENDGTFETPGQTVEFSGAGLDGPWTHAISVQVADPDGLTASAETTVEVRNVAPEVGPITAPVDPVTDGTTIEVSAEFTDVGILDTHTAEWDWGDESTSLGDVTEADGRGIVMGSHSYDTPGVYTIKVTVTDDDGDSDESVYQYVVVYDPGGGFVTGGGWIMSPEGAYADAPTLTGRANFGFVSKYKKGANVPTGDTEFQFHAGDLNFHSTEYQWLVVAGPQAKFKGSGTINGEGGYGFMVSARDGEVSGGGGVDKFRIKIGDKATDAIVYDNQMGEDDDSEAATEIGGGSIVIHKAG